MGQAAGAAGLIKAFNCSCISDLAKYVCNSGRFRSKCCSCCELSIETDAISVASDDSGEERLEVAGCLKWLKK